MIPICSRRTRRRSSPLRAAALGVLLFGLAAGCGGAPRTAAATADASRIVAARAYVDSLRDALGLPGVAVTVSRDGREVMSEGFGFADIARGTPATAQTRFRVGSVSKLFTAVALMRLAEEEVIDLDAPLRRYLDGLATNWPDITLRQLAGHTAGVRHYRGSEFFSRTRYATLSDAMGIFASDSLRFPPGSEYAYSSHGYVVIGAAMERATGETFPALLHRTVLAPLEMKHTVPDSGRADEDTAVLYSIGQIETTIAPTDDLSSRWPAGGYLSTTADLARFGGRALRPGFLGPAARQEMLSPQRLPDGSTTGVGIGWRTSADSASRNYVHHGGSSNGGSAILVVYPEQGLVVAMASNAFARWGLEEALRVASMFLDR